MTELQTAGFLFVILIAIASIWSVGWFIHSDIDQIRKVLWDIKELLEKKQK